MSSNAALKGLVFYAPIGSSVKKSSKTLQTLITSHGGAWATAFSDKVRLPLFLPSFTFPTLCTPSASLLLAYPPYLSDIATHILTLKP